MKDDPHRNRCFLAAAMNQAVQSWHESPSLMKRQAVALTQVTRAEAAAAHEVRLRTDLEEKMKQAFMRGVCTLNLEVRQLFIRSACCCICICICQSKVDQRSSANRTLHMPHRPAAWRVLAPPPDTNGQHLYEAPLQAQEIIEQHTPGRLPAVRREPPPATAGHIAQSAPIPAPRYWERQAGTSGAAQPQPVDSEATSRRSLLRHEPQARHAFSQPAAADHYLQRTASSRPRSAGRSPLVRRCLIKSLDAAGGNEQQSDGLVRVAAARGGGGGAHLSVVHQAEVEPVGRPRLPQPVGHGHPPQANVGFQRTHHAVLTF